MSGTDGRVEDHRVWLWILGGFSLVLAALLFQQMFFRYGAVTQGPWQAVDPGQPKGEPLRFDVLREGSGPKVEPGDLIRLSLARVGGGGWEKGKEGWVWIGFRIDGNSLDPRLLAAFIGQREGSELRFTESRKGGNLAGSMYLNPLGDHRKYAWKKGVGIEEGLIYALGSSGYTAVSLEKVFKGQLKSREIRLCDEGRRTGSSSGPKKAACEIPLQEARFEGVSADGRRATFQYGPLDVSWLAPPTRSRSAGSWWTSTGTRSAGSRRRGKNSPWACRSNELEQINLMTPLYSQNHRMKPP
jgi:hypothetical protein